MGVFFLGDADKCKSITDVGVPNAGRRLCFVLTDRNTYLRAPARPLAGATAVRDPHRKLWRLADFRDTGDGLLVTPTPRWLRPCSRLLVGDG